MFVFVLDITVVVQGKMTVRQTDGDINWGGRSSNNMLLPPRPAKNEQRSKEDNGNSNNNITMFQQVQFGKSCKNVGNVKSLSEFEALVAFLNAKCQT